VRPIADFRVFTAGSIIWDQSIPPIFIRKACAPKFADQGNRIQFWHCSDVCWWTGSSARQRTLMLMGTQHRMRWMPKHGYSRTLIGLSIAIASRRKHSGLATSCHSSIAASTSIFSRTMCASSVRRRRCRSLQTCASAYSSRARTSRQGCTSRGCQPCTRSASPGVQRSSRQNDPKRMSKQDAIDCRLCGRKHARNRCNPSHIRSALSQANGHCRYLVEPIRFCQHEPVSGNAAALCTPRYRTFFGNSVLPNGGVR